MSIRLKYSTITKRPFNRGLNSLIMPHYNTTKENGQLLLELNAKTESQKSTNNAKNKYLINLCKHLIVLLITLKN